MAKYYQVSVILHSDCCSIDSIDWLDGMIEANEVIFKATFFGYLLHYIKDETLIVVVFYET